MHPMKILSDCTVQSGEGTFPDVAVHSAHNYSSMFIVSVIIYAMMV